MRWGLTTIHTCVSWLRPSSHIVTVIVGEFFICDFQFEIFDSQIQVKDEPEGSELSQGMMLSTMLLPGTPVTLAGQELGLSSLQEIPWDDISGPYPFYIFLFVIPVLHFFKFVLFVKSTIQIIKYDFGELPEKNGLKNMNFILCNRIHYLSKVSVWYPKFGFLMILLSVLVSKNKI